MNTATNFQKRKNNLFYSISQKNKNTNKKAKKTSIFASFFVIFLIFLMIFLPKLCISSIHNGLLVWATCIVPSLLPFMFFTKILTGLGFISHISTHLGKVPRKLFGAPKISAYIFLMSIVSGYPVGAKLISEYKQMGLISTKQANKLCTFCSTSGPLFVVGSVGTSMLANTKIGYIILIAHILSSIANGIVFRCAFVDKTEVVFEHKKDISQNILADSMKDSILSVLCVGGFVAVAFLVIAVFEQINLFLPIIKLFENFGVDGGITKSVLTGFLEVSNGCLTASKLTISMPLKASIASFFVGFGGLSVFLQASAFLKTAGVNLKFYFAQKISHGFLNAIFTFLICLIFKI